MNDRRLRRLDRTPLILAGLWLLAGCGGGSPEQPSSSAGTSGTTNPGGVLPSATGGTTSGASGAGAGPASGSAGRSSAGTGTGTVTAGGMASTASGSGAAGASAAAGTTASGGAGTAANGGTGNSGDVGNYFVSGSWHGYAWADVQGMGSTITPMDFSAQTTGMPRCVMGSVAATMDYSGVALLGLNLNQDMSTDAPLMTVTPTKAGVMLDFTQNAPSPLRFQVQTPTAGTAETWCIDVSAPGFIPWTSLKTECWGSTGKAYANEPISAAMLMVPGGMSAAIPFDFCINSLVEADGPSAGAAGSGAAGGAAPAAGSGGAGGSPTGGSAGSTSSGGSNMSPPPIQGGCKGFATRYWDCCKPHCGWKANVPGGSEPIASCDESDNPISDPDAASGCNNGSAHLCHSMVPWAINDQLSYGFSAVAASGTDICGKCYQLQFTGVSENAGEDPGSTAIGGKTLIVQAINIGGDVGSGQFDVSIPGGGVGMFDACSSQWGVPTSELGQQYGGFLPRCKEQVGRTNHAALKECVMQACNNVFEKNGLSELQAGCKWYVDWMQVADNPAVMYKEVACPDELLNHGGVRRSGGPSDACVQ